MGGLFLFSAFFWLSFANVRDEVIHLALALRMLESDHLEEEL